MNAKDWLCQHEGQAVRAQDSTSARDRLHKGLAGARSAVATARWLREGEGQAV